MASSRACTIRLRNITRISAFRPKRTGTGTGSRRSRSFIWRRRPPASTSPAATRSLLFEPGTKWSYSDGGPNWLAECVTLAYGRDLQELMFERVFSPIGIGRDDLKWRANSYRPKEINGVGPSGVRARASPPTSTRWPESATCTFARVAGRTHQIIPSWFVDAARTVPRGVRGLPVLKPEDYGNASDHYGLGPAPARHRLGRRSSGRRPRRLCPPSGAARPAARRRAPARRRRGRRLTSAPPRMMPSARR